VALTARYRSPATFEYVQDACCDVSVGGMFIKSDTPAAAGTLIKLECETDSDGAKIRGVARVVWLRREPNEHGPTGMGVKFVKLESGSKEVISRLVQKLADAGIEPRSISAPPEGNTAQQPARPAATSTPSAKPLAPSVTTAATSKTTAAIAATSKTTTATTATAATAAVARAVAPEPAAALRTAPAEVATPQPTASHAPESVSEAAHPEAPAQMQMPVAIAPREAAAPAGKPAIAADATTDSTPPRPRSRGAVRVWIGLLVAVLILVAIIFADDVPNGSSLTATPNDNSASTQVPAISPIEQGGPSAPAPSAQQASAEKATSETIAANEPSPARPAIETAPSAAPGQAAEPAPTAQSAAAAGPGVGATQAAEPEIPYVIEFVSRPDGATITVGEQSLVTPGELNLGAMPNRVKVIATKAGYQPSSAWVYRTDFKRVDGVLRRRVYMMLPVEQPAAKAPQP
jgi:Tfp pilus assembly protein PilZ